ncbi:MAG: hypothetical protein MPK62_12605, partial [Alphaproteobacteria bacterium]|nr:hypothetical protein [Alphaproteobacteria bacterium]
MSTVAAGLSETVSIAAPSLSETVTGEETLNKIALLSSTSFAAVSLTTAALSSLLSVSYTHL